MPSIDFNELSNKEKRVLIWLYTFGEEGVRDKPHCDACNCDCAETDLTIEDYEILTSLLSRGYADCWIGYDVDGRCANYWNVPENHRKEIDNYINNEEF